MTCLLAFKSFGLLATCLLAASHLVKRMVPDTKMTIGKSKKIHVKGKEGKNAETKKKDQKFVASLLAVLGSLRISTRHATAWRLWFWRPLWCPQAAVPRFWRSTLNWYEWPRVPENEMRYAAFWREMPEMWDPKLMLSAQNSKILDPEAQRWFNFRDGVQNAARTGWSF